MFYDLEVLDQNLYLLPEKAIYWKQRKTLIVADVHIGKSGHFRRNGIPVSNEVNKENLNRLTNLIHNWETERVIFLGDLFHSFENHDWSIFWEWLESNKRIDFILTLGNHDAYQKDIISDSSIVLVDELQDGPFLFVHEYQKEISNVERFVISGHIHPSVTIRGKGRQRLRLSCFAVDGRNILLPAFGSFTGTHPIKKSNDVSIFGIIEDSVMEI